MTQRQATASFNDPLLCDSLVKKGRKNTVCKLLEVIKDAIVFRMAKGVPPIGSQISLGFLWLPMRVSGTAKITLVPEPKDLHFPLEPFGETSAPVHQGQPRLLLCACTCVKVFVCVFALSLYCRETVKG